MNMKNRHGWKDKSETNVNHTIKPFSEVIKETNVEMIEGEVIEEDE